MAMSKTMFLGKTVNRCFSSGKKRGAATLRWLIPAIIASLILSMLPLSTPVLAGGGITITRTFQTPNADTYLRQDQTDRNYGGSTFVYVMAEADKARRTILKYDIGTIPTSSNVSGATLSLYYYDMKGGPGSEDPVGRTYYTYRITETDWVEGTSVDEQEAGASSWTHRQYDTLSWTTAGGTYTTTDNASTTVPAAFGWMNWSVTNQAQYTVTNAISPHFLIKDSDESLKSGCYFYSKEEETQTTLRPKLSITFTAPWDSHTDSGRSDPPEDTFASPNKTVYMKGTTFATGTYNVAYYDAGASGGQKSFTQSNVSVAGDGILNSSYLLTTDNTSAAGTWHTLVQPTGATTFPTNYNDAVAAPDTYDLIANDSFTVEQSAISYSRPVVDAVAIYETDHSTPVTAMTPQTEYAVKVTMTDEDTLDDLNTVKVTIFYDTDGDNDPGDVPGTGDTQNAAILTCTVGYTPSWQIDPSTSTTWVLVTGNCVQPTLTGIAGDFWFHFKPGKVAAKATDWDAYSVASDGKTSPGALYDSSGYDMNWYCEISVNTVSVNFNSVDLGSDFGDNQVTDISITYIANGAYNKQVKASSPWDAGANQVSLEATGNPGDGQFSLKAYYNTTLGDAVLVLSTGYTTFGTGTQTGESGITEDTNTLWLKLGASGIPGVTYSGTIYYQIAE